MEYEQLRQKLSLALTNFNVFDEFIEMITEPWGPITKDDFLFIESECRSDNPDLNAGLKTLMLSYVYRLERNFPKSIELCEEIINSAINSRALVSRAYCNLAEIYARFDDVNKAKELYKKAIAFGDNSSPNRMHSCYEFGLGNSRALGKLSYYSFIGSPEWRKLFYDAIEVAIAGKYFSAVLYNDLEIANQLFQNCFSNFREMFLKYDINSLGVDRIKWDFFKNILKVKNFEELDLEKKCFFTELRLRLLFTAESDEERDSLSFSDEQINKWIIEVKSEHLRDECATEYFQYLFDTWINLPDTGEEFMLTSTHLQERMLSLFEDFKSRFTPQHITYLGIVLLTMTFGKDYNILSSYDLSIDDLNLLILVNRNESHIEELEHLKDRLLGSNSISDKRLTPRQSLKK